MQITDEMVAAYLEAQHKFVFEADNVFPRHIGALHTNVVKEACRAGLTAAFKVSQSKDEEPVLLLNLNF